MGGIKEKLYNYFNQNYQNMFNRFIVTSEDEMVKKVRNFIDKEEMKTLARYTPKEIAALLDQVGGIDKFNTGEIEKSIVNMYGHLQGHIQRGVNDLENVTNSLLRQKTDVGAFIRGENAYSIVKCSFKDNPNKPKTVTDVKLSVNILDSELISPIFHYQVTVEFLIKDMISKNIMDLIDKEIEKLKDQVVDEGREELSDGEILFEKMKRVEKFTSDDKDDPKSKRYIYFAKALMDKIEGLRAEIDPEEYDPVNIRENLKRIIDIENIRNRGFNTAINSITSILDTSKMGYQHVENLKNARELVLREYEDTDYDHLPDERYAIRLKYYDQAQLLEERKAYDVQAKSFEIEVQHLWDVLEMVYEDSKFMKGVVDFDDLAKRMKGKIKRRIKARTGDPLYEDIEKSWSEVTFVKSGDTDVERMNRTYIAEKDEIKRRDHPHEGQAAEDVRLPLPHPAPRHRRAAGIPGEAVPRLRIPHQPVPHPAGAPAGREHHLDQEEEGDPGRHGQRAERVPLRRVQGIPGRGIRLVLPPPLHGARGHRAVLRGNGPGRCRGGRAGRQEVRVSRHAERPVAAAARQGAEQGVVDVAPAPPRTPAAKAAKRGRPRKGSSDVGLREI